MELAFNETKEHAIIGESVDMDEGKARPQFVEYCDHERVFPVSCLYI